MYAPYILVVEDEPVVALQLRRQLTNLGYHVPLAVASGDEVLREIEASRPDLVLMDINIEGQLDGIATAARIPAEYRIPVVYLTAYSEEDKLRRASETNPYGYLLKPFSERELHATIQMALARCEAEAALFVAERRLRRQQKMEAVARLAGGMANDLNNLLTIMYSNLEVLDEQAADQPPLNVKPVREIFEAATEAESLVRKLLAFSRRQAISPDSVAVNTLVLNMASALRQALGRSVRVDLRLPRDLWAVCIDVEEFETALLNIADNAREAMPNGGIFSIVGRNIDSGEDYAQEYAEAAAEVPSGRHVLLSLTDNGAGMADDVIERAFEPFSTTKPTGQATGLGLSQVFGFVRQSGGHITLVSAPGTGTSVRVLLPAVVDAVEEVERPPGMGGSYPLAPHGEVVLVVEHDERVRHHIVGGLARLGYTAIEAGTAAAALELLRAGERVDLLMLDAVMPNGDHGTTFAREAVACRPGLKILYLSGHTQSALARDGIIGSNDPVLLKPFLKAELARGVRAVLDAGGEEEG